MKRPIEKLFPLEIRCQEDVSTSDIEAANNGDGIENDESKCDANNGEKFIVDRPRRIAADNGILIRRILGT